MIWSLESLLENEPAETTAGTEGAGDHQENEAAGGAGDGTGGAGSGGTDTGDSAGSGGTDARDGAGTGDGSAGDGSGSEPAGGGEETSSDGGSGGGETGSSEDSGESTGDGEDVGTESGDGTATGNGAEGAGDGDGAGGAEGSEAAGGEESAESSEAAEGESSESGEGGGTEESGAGSEEGSADTGDEGIYTGSEDAGDSYHSGYGGGGGGTGPLGPSAVGGPLGPLAGTDYVIAEDEETEVIFTSEPETEYIVGTPANGTNVFSKTYSAAVGAITKTAQNAAKSAKPALKTMGLNLLNAVLILFIGIQLARLLRKMMQKTFEQLHLDSSLKSFLSSLVYVATCGISGFVALERLGVSSASIVALLGSAGLAVSLSLQDFLGNFAGGVIIMILKPFRSGDYIICGNVEGIVSATSIFYTTLNTIDNRQIIMPNGALSNANIINVTAEAKRRLEVRVDISYSSDIRKAKEIIRGLFENHPDIIKEDDIVVFVDQLGDSGITLVGRGWILQEKYWPAKWAITEDLKYAFDSAGIEIPFTQMDVHIRDGSTVKTVSVREGEPPRTK